ncbi:MAG: hypothetical protein IJB53_03365 [Mailhella sp.]|nr:hypothetical protein [Mailhella sp.]
MSNITNESSHVVDRDTRREHLLDLSPKQLRELKPLARYIWWQTPEEALKRPDLLIAQVMNIGIYADICKMIAIVGNEPLITVLHNAEAGQFDQMSWDYWHYRLTDVEVGKVPPLPQRRFHD